jgi:hypothetical protein
MVSTFANDELPRESRKLLDPPLREAALEDDIPPLNPSGVAKPSNEGRVADHSGKMRENRCVGCERASRRDPMVSDDGLLGADAMAGCAASGVGGGEAPVSERAAQEADSVRTLLGAALVVGPSSDGV